MDSGRRRPSTTLPPLRLHPQSSCGRGREPRWGRTGEREAPTAGLWGRPVASFLPVAGSLLERTPWPAPPRSAILPAIPHLGTSPSPRRCWLCVQGLTPPPSVQGRHPTRGPWRPNSPSLTPGPGRPRAQLRGFRSQAPPRRPHPRTPGSAGNRQDSLPRQMQSFPHHITGGSPHSEEKGWWSRQK